MSSKEPHEPLVGYFRTPADIDRDRLEAFAQKLRKRLAGGRFFSCRITGDAEMRRLNHDYLGHDYPTDVLSFPADGPDGSLGDLAISRQRAAAQALEHGHDIHQELEILMLHGLLHLLGHDHETDAGEMARVETRWRKQLGLPGGLIERSRA